LLIVFIEIYDDCAIIPRREFDKEFENKSILAVVPTGPGTLDACNHKNKVNLLIYNVALFQDKACLIFLSM
jgi:hypothetical protein